MLSKSEPGPCHEASMTAEELVGEIQDEEKGGVQGGVVAG